MKFLCDNCKAKYQIGDEKVAGKTVRMKCRRCGHLIQVSASVTESSVARRLPTEDGSAPAHEAPAAPHPERIGNAGATGKPQHPGSILEEESEENDERTVMMTRPSQIPGRPSADGPRPMVALGPLMGKAGAAGANAPRPGGGLPPRPAAGAVVPRATATAAARPLAQPRAALAPVPAPREAPPASSAAPASGGMAGAFVRAVAEPPAALRQAATHGDDWYVGVGGVPLGPVRLSVIREKAESGAVDGDSLVWREGFDEWQPLKKFPELLEVVTEARTSGIPGRRSSTGRLPTPVPGFSALSPSASRSSNTPAAAPRTSAAGERSTDRAEAAALASATPRTSAAGERSTDRAAASALASASSTPAAAFAPAPAPVASAPAPAAISMLADPFAPSAPAPGLFGPAAAPKPVALAPIEIIEPGPLSSPPDSILVPGRRRRGMHPMAYAFIAMAAVFGGVAAFVLLSPKAVVVNITAPATVTTPQLQGESPPPPPVAVNDGVDAGAAVPETTAVAAARPGGPLGPRPSAEPKAGTSAPIDTSGFGGVGGPSGPSAVGPGGPGPTAGGQLSGGEINGVVASNQAILRRKCWQPALDSAPKAGPKSAKVSTQITIGPSGNVDNVSAGGGNEFPGLASCIASRVKGWKFPPSGGTTTVSVPFSFIDQ